MNILIVDDEKLSRERIRVLLESQKDVHISGECKNGKEALEVITSTKIDLVFLDIQMPELDGIRLIEHLPIQNIPLIIFTTAYDEFAVKAFELNAVDYLLKPFTKIRFEQSLQRVREMMKTTEKDFYLSQLSALAKTIIDKKAFPDRIFIKTEGKIKFQLVEDILWMESEGNYIKIHMSGEVHIFRETLTKFSTKLDPAVFIRTHRSVLVNVKYIKEIKPWFNDEQVIILNNGTQLPIGRTYKKQVASFLNL